MVKTNTGFHYIWIYSRAQRQGHYRRWSGTFIQQGINYRKVTLNMLVDVEVVLVDIWIGKTKTKIINFYNPCKIILREMLDRMYEGENGKVICGDFNAHNTLWGGTKVEYY